MSNDLPEQTKREISTILFNKPLPKFKSIPLRLGEGRFYVVKPGRGLFIQFTLLREISRIVYEKTDPAY